VEHYILQTLYSGVEKKIRKHHYIIVYLRTTPEKAFERVNIRGRLGEQDITLSYLQNIHNKHEDWLGQHKIEKEETVCKNQMPFPNFTICLLL
jgi:deoxyadenosine/deoxycytidine kinase